ncbi:MAG: hypothetical protein US63_C0015G0024 [Candidatus Moranbacteria bacterium GW2011_GWC2_37_8]|nr:MAG: hypothetical protein US63_C0015G0024 [Candidatus Moranbacteria bacterium GW2011_GWC2_37_8]KKQ62362.1 MAG: hypothetical protein US82_C0013G0032 [Parcubacteria group bacterium GW2011_GWC1_38_22]KKQ81175.1 MAG: hypothetical protein UT03_C0009G0002 [Candidatus Moranbacteria bacterium GW2011_GWD2_38_7]
MQDFFQKLQGKLWIYLVNLFNKSVDLSVNTWQSLEPMRKTLSDYLVTVSSFFNNILDFCLAALVHIGSYIEKLSSLAGNEYATAKPIVINWSEKNKLAAAAATLLVLLILFFWFWMIRHAKKNEIVWKKTWIFIMISLGPIGAIIYFFLRKLRVEKKQNEHDRVMMSFFTPMHKNEDEVKSE